MSKHAGKIKATVGMEAMDSLIRGAIKGAAKIMEQPEVMCAACGMQESEMLKVFKSMEKERLHNALRAASAAGFTAVVKSILACDAEYEAPDEEGRTALRYAAEGGHADVVTLLLGRGAKADSRDKKDNTPLLRAAGAGHAEVVNVLLKSGSVPDSRALPLAARHGYVQVVSLLLYPGIMVDSSALRDASWHGHTEVVELLLAAVGDDVDLEDVKDALHYASTHGHKKVAKVLEAFANERLQRLKKEVGAFGKRKARYRLESEVWN